MLRDRGDAARDDQLAPLFLAARDDPGVELELLSTGQHHEIHDEVLALLGSKHRLAWTSCAPGPERHRGCRPAAWSLFEPVLGGAPPPTSCSCRATRPRRSPPRSRRSTRASRVGHVEAGLRTGDADVALPGGDEPPADVAARRAALRADHGVSAREPRCARASPPRRIVVTGNTGHRRAALGRRGSTADGPPLRRSRRRRAGCILVTAHRRENFGEPLRAHRRGARATLADRDPDVELRLPGAPEPERAGALVRAAARRAPARRCSPTAGLRATSCALLAALPRSCSPTRAASRRRRRRSASPCS